MNDPNSENVGTVNTKTQQQSQHQPQHLQRRPHSKLDSVSASTSSKLLFDAVPTSSSSSSSTFVSTFSATSRATSLASTATAAAAGAAEGNLNFTFSGAFPLSSSSSFSSSSAAVSFSVSRSDSLSASFLSTIPTASFIEVHHDEAEEDSNSALIRTNSAASDLFATTAISIPSTTTITAPAATTSSLHQPMYPPTATPLRRRGPTKKQPRKIVPQYLGQAADTTQQIENVDATVLPFGASSLSAIAAAATSSPIAPVLQATSSPQTESALQATPLRSSMDYFGSGLFSPFRSTPSSGLFGTPLTAATPSAVPLSAFSSSPLPTPLFMRTPLQDISPNLSGRQHQHVSIYQQERAARRGGVDSIASGPPIATAVASTLPLPQLPPRISTLPPPPTSSSFTSSSSSSFSRIPLPPQYLRVLEEAQAITKVASSAFASGYKGPRTKPTAAAAAASSTSSSSTSASISNLAFSGSTWSNFTFDPHAFSSVSSSQSDSLTTGVVASSTDSVGARTSEQLVASQAASSSSLFQQMLDQERQSRELLELQEMEKLKQSYESQLTGPRRARPHHDEDAEQQADQFEPPALPTTHSPRKMVHIAQGGQPRASIIPEKIHEQMKIEIEQSSQLHLTPPRNASVGEAITATPSSASSSIGGLITEANRALHILSPAPIPFDSSDPAFLTPTAPTRGRGRPPKNAAAAASVAGSATSAALASLSAPTSAGRLEVISAGRKVASEGKKLSGTKRARSPSISLAESRSASPSTLASSEIFSPESLRMRKKHVRMITTAAAAVIVLSPSAQLSLSTLTVPISSDLTGVIAGFNEGHIRQLRAQIQLHAQLLAQTAWLCTHLPTRTRSRLQKGDYAQILQSTKELMQQLDAHCPSEEGTQLQQQQQQLAVEPVEEDQAMTDEQSERNVHDDVAQIILGLGGNMSESDRDDTPFSFPELISPDSLRSRASSPPTKKRKMTKGKKGVAVEKAEEEEELPLSYRELGPYSENTPFLPANTLQVLRVPAIALGRDNRIRSLVVTDFEDDKENLPQTISAAAASSSSTISQLSKSPSVLTRSAIEAFWTPLVRVYALDARKLPKMAAERHLWTAGEANLLALAINTLQWKNLSSIESPELRENTERSMITAMRRRYLPAKTSKDVRDRLVKLKQSDDAIKEKLMQPTSSTPMTAQSTSSDTRMIDATAASTPAAATIPSSTASYSLVPQHYVPVTMLRDLSPHEIALVQSGLAEFANSRSVWSDISSKYLPHWPRKLLAKAWTKKVERDKKGVVRKGRKLKSAKVESTTVAASAVNEPQPPTATSSVVSLTSHHAVASAAASSISSTSTQLEMELMVDEEEDEMEAPALLQPQTPFVVQTTATQPRTI